MAAAGSAGGAAADVAAGTLAGALGFRTNRPVRPPAAAAWVGERTAGAALVARTHRPNRTRHCGLAAGVANVIAGHPFDTVKVLLQSEPGRFPSASAAAMHIVRTSGVRLPPHLHRG